MNVRPGLHNKKSVVNTKAFSSVLNSKLNVNYDLKCATCNGCLFSNNHDSCVLEFINSVNARVKSKSAKKLVKRKFWQPTGKVFTTVGHKWRPTGRTFTLVRNVCPLTRITTTTIVPLRKPIHIESNTSRPVVTLVYLRKSKEAKNTVLVSNPKINKSLVANKKVVQIVLWYLDSGCSKHMIGDRSQLINFVQKFLGTVKFRNDHVAKIMGYGDYKIGNVTISKVGISHETLVARSPQQNGVVERRNEAVATACYTQNRSIIRLRHGKTPYELLHNKLFDLSFLHVFGTLCDPTNDSENLGKLQLKADIRIFIGYAPIKKAFWIYNRRARRIVETIHVDFDEQTAMASEQRIDQDAPSPSKSQTTPKTQSSIIPQDVKEDIHDIEVAHMGNDPLFSVLIPEVASAQSSSTTYKDALTQSCWIEAMQEELNEFKRFEVWELVPRPDKVMAITLKWIYKPDGFVDQDNPNHVYKLKKALYGLKQALRACGYSNGGKSKLDKDKEEKAVDPSHYHGIIGTLLYLTASRPDLQFSICTCARYQAQPIKKHIHAVKRIFRYLRRIVNRGLWYPKDSSVALTTFADADHAGCQDTCRSTSGSLQFLGDRLISWSLKRQKSASKHIDIRYHFIKERVENGVIKLYFINTEYQLADLFTKALGKDRIEFLINKLGM
nr:hypothetical protein [Tanacetum cinerariifolium]